MWFLSKIEIEHCSPVSNEESHELGVWFLSETKKERCVPLCGVRKPMSWVRGSSLRHRWNVVYPVRGEGAHVMGLLLSSMHRVEMIL